MSDSEDEKVEIESPSQILPGLWIGGVDVFEEDDNFFSENQITHLLLLSDVSRPPKVEAAILAQRLTLKYVKHLENDRSTDLTEEFEQCSAFVHRARVEEKSVLVQCDTGTSVGPALVAAYLMGHLETNYQQSVKIIRSERSSIDINAGFVNQLIRSFDCGQLHQDLIAIAGEKQKALQKTDGEHLEKAKDSWLKQWSEARTAQISMLKPEVAEVENKVFNKILPKSTQANRRRLIARGRASLMIAGTSKQVAFTNAFTKLSIDDGPAPWDVLPSRARSQTTVVMGSDGRRDINLPLDFMLPAAPAPKPAPPPPRARGGAKRPPPPPPPTIKE